jgi:membrane protease YdiL (CAAX protease family)
MPLAPTPRTPRLSRAAVIGLLYAALGLVAVAIGAWRGNCNVYEYGPRRATSTLWLMASPFVGLAFGLAMVFLSRLAVHSMEWARVLHREFHALVHELTAREIFVLAAASSVGEELLFRGALLPMMGLLPSSALFAAMHVRAQWRFLPWTIMSFIMGLAMGLLFVRLGNLGAPIVAHFTINLLNLNYIAKTELRA